MRPHETIFALATVPGRSAIAVVRVSGDRAHEAVDALCGRAVTPDRVMRLRLLRGAGSGEIIDQALVAAFPPQSSPTGERYAELHVHGGVAAPAAVLAALGAMGGLRQAQPGEFARRALENDRLDLTQVEGIADLVDAQTEGQRRQALRLVQGGLSDKVAEWRGALVQARALIEASIDFSDEDLPEDLTAEALAIVASLARELRAELRGATAGRIVREGLEVAIIGPPNAGKSSLINMLGGREVALTAPTPGTTRDVVELRCAVNGHLVTFLDTAGLREASDPVERAGVALARRRAAAADMRIVVWAPDCDRAPAVEADDLLVWNKADMAPGPGVNVSALSGDGAGALMAAVGKRLSSMTREADLLVRERHREMLETACGHLESAPALSVELCAEELRLATAALDRLIGRVDCDQVLGQIFSQLCIGK